MMPKQGLIERELAEQGLTERNLAESVGMAGRSDCEPGQGLAEYAILLMAVSIVMATILTSIGTTVTAMYVRISGAFPVL